MKRSEKAAKQLAILQVLHKALLLDGEMFESLYEHEMQEHIAYWTEGMRKDKNDFVFVVTENNGHAAMVVITKEEELLINEPARAYLKKIWQKNYAKNIEMLSWKNEKNASCLYTFCRHRQHGEGTNQARHHNIHLQQAEQHLHQSPHQSVGYIDLDVPFQFYGRDAYE